MFHSVRARLTLWYTLVMAVVLISFSIISYAQLARAIRWSTDTSLADTAHELAAALSRDPSGAMSTSESGLDFRHSRREISVLTKSGDAIASSPGILTTAEHRDLRDRMRKGQLGLMTLAGGEENDGIRVFAMPIAVLGQPYVIVVSQELADQADQLESAAHALFLGIPLALLLASAGGYLLARTALQPVATMSLKARQIGAETLTERIPEGNSRDELGLLAVTLNELLGRLQASFESQRGFVADASHELRTPVSIIQGEADVTLSRPERTGQEYRESMEVIQKASLKLTKIVENLFLLARTDAGAFPINRNRFYLDELIAECVRSLRNIASRSRVVLTTSTESDMLLAADEGLVHRLLLNLIDNALKFTPAGGTIQVVATRADQDYVIDVIDSGQGIPEPDQSRVFERFYRVPVTPRQRPATNATSGAGLGLPIARWIAESHGGRLTLLRSGPGGSTFRVTIPSGIHASADRPS